MKRRIVSDGFIDGSVAMLVVAAAMCAEAIPVMAGLLLCAIALTVYKAARGTANGKEGK